MEQSWGLSLELLPQVLSQPVGPFGLGAESRQEKLRESEKLELLLVQTTLCSFSLTGVCSRFMGKRVIPVTGPICLQSLDPSGTDSTRQPLPALQCLSETPVAFLCVSNKVKLILNCWCFWRESGPWEHAFAPCRLWQCHLLAKQTPFLSCLYQLSIRSSLVRFASDHCPLHGHPSQNKGHVLEGWVAGRQNIALWLSKDISSYPKCCSLHPLEIFL